MTNYAEAFLAADADNLLPSDAANSRAARGADEERRQRMYDSERGNGPDDALLTALAAKQADKPADHFDTAARAERLRERRRSMFASHGAAWTLGQSLKNATVHRIAQTLAIVVLSVARTNGANLSESLGKLTHEFEQTLRRYGIGRGA